MFKGSTFEVCIYILVKQAGIVSDSTVQIITRKQICNLI